MMISTSLSNTQKDHYTTHLYRWVFLYYEVFIIMKIIITESQKKLLFENSMKDNLINSIKEDGFESASELVGGTKNLLKLLKIKDPMDFLNLFNGLDVVQSKEKPHWDLFRYKPKHNLMVYDRKIDHVYVNYQDIWSVLKDNFDLNYSDIQDLMKVWLDEAYNLRGVTPLSMNHSPRFKLD